MDASASRDIVAGGGAAEAVVEGMTAASAFLFLADGGGERMTS